jgi:peptidoglycan hydrolase-like protein with peptidoglycan-binding domain
MQGLEGGCTRRTAVTAAVGAGTVGIAGLVTPQAVAATVRTLERGHRGADVVALQKRLAALSYWCGAADGSFGHLTQQAVWALQKVGGVARSGKVGATERVLLSRGVRPKPRTVSGHCIEVDLRRQILICGINGGTSLVFNTSTGNGERYYSRGSWRTAYTPTGSFKIYYRYSSGWQYGTLGAMWRPAYFKSGWAIHGSTSIPPYPASHGCARLSTKAMDLLYARGWPTIGRKVWVY